MWLAYPQSQAHSACTPSALDPSPGPVPLTVAWVQTTLWGQALPLYSFSLILLHLLVWAHAASLLDKV